MHSIPGRRLIMSLFLVILMGYYMWSIHRAQKEVQTL